MKPQAALLPLILMIGCQQNVDLSAIAPRISKVTVYDCEGRGGPSITASELADVTHAELSADLMRELLPEARFRNERVLWKGSLLAIVTMDDGTEKRLALSPYGAFFEIAGEPGYFYLEGAARGAFEKAFSKGIIQDQFIPKRVMRNAEQGKLHTAH